VSWQLTPYNAPLLIGAAVCSLIAWRAWTRRRSFTGARALSVLMVAAAWWCGLYALELTARTLPQLIASANAQYLGILPLTPAFLLFAMQYTKRGRKATRALVGGLSAAQLAVGLALALDATHSWYRVNPRMAALVPHFALVYDAGPFFWLQLVDAYAAMSIGTALIFRRLSTAPGLPRRQAIVILLGILAPCSANIVTHVTRSPFPDLDLTPYGLAVTGVVLGFGVLRLRLLEFVPSPPSLVLDTLADGLVLLDEQERVVSVNAAAQRMLPALADPLGRPVDEVLRDVPRLLEAYRRLRLGEAVEIEWDGAGVTWMEREVTPLPEAGAVWLELWLAPLPAADGRAPGRVLQLRDATKRRAALEALRQSEAELRALFASMRDVILVLDRSGRYLKIAPSSPDLLYRPAADMLGRTLHEIFPAREADFFLSHVRRCLEERSTIQMDYSLPLGERTVWFSAQLSPRSDDTVVLVARDVTRAREAELERSRLEAEVRRSETMAAMGAIVAGVAHEVRNPLFSISATTEAFEARHQDAATARPYLENLRREVDRLNVLMSDLLELGRPPSRETEAGDLAPVAREAFDSMRPFADVKGVVLDIAWPAALPRIRFDRRRMLLVFRNLAENAIEYSPVGGRVSASAGVDHVDGKDWLVCWVQDSGRGFAPEDMQRVFEPFFTRRRGGTGLGLSIAQRIVEEHGGTIGVANAEGGGGRVTLRLPVFAASAS
jgi:PAS domain S-box-containing protein